MPPLKSILEEWNLRLLTREETGTPPDLVLHSWTRSHAAGLDPASGSLNVPRISHRELNQLLAEYARVLAVAEPHLEALSRATPVPHVAYLACREGIVLTSIGDDEAQMRAFGLTPGHDWSERAMGTNGAGTALAARVPVTIFGQDHYLKPLKGFVCTAAPIRDATGEAIAALDLSTSVPDGRPEFLLRVVDAAAAIEGELRR